MTKSCKNCNKDFIIESDDLSFYERIKVPAPTWCPDCRFQRRMSWRNGWHLFRNKDARDGKELLSFLPPENKIPVFERDYWYSDALDAMDYGEDYDFSRPFFEQFKKLMHKVPEPAHSSLNLVNCRYCTNIADAKNCYLVRGATYTEDCAYIIWDHGSRQCMDSHMTKRCELGYGNVNVENSYKALFSVDCSDCQDVILSTDCVGCNNCIGCFGLRSKSYCIFNEQFSKEEYEKKVKDMNLGSYKSFLNIKKKAYEFWKTKPHKFMHGLKNVNVSGDYIFESKNARHCYRVRGVEDSKYVQNLLEKSTKDSYDYSNFGEGAELCYETLVAGRGVSNIKFSTHIYVNAKDIEYSIFCRNSSDLFGCIGLRDKQYCIFNKQYAKEEYEITVAKIKKHMNDMPYVDSVGREYKYGEFFPPELSPFPYRVTDAYEFFPMNAEDAKNRGFLWYELSRQDYKVTMRTSEIPDHINDAHRYIVDQIIECDHKGTCDQECTGAFRVIPEEVIVLQRIGIPLPRLCPNCRHYERLEHRNKPLWHDRKCDKCGKDISTSYDEGIVYCEQCYNSEIL